MLLFNTGQIPREPMHGLRSDVIWKQQPVPPGTPSAIAAPIDRWLSGRLQTTDRAESVRGARDAFRYLLTWLAGNHPEITSLTELNRGHIEAILTPTCTTASTRVTDGPWRPGPDTATSARC